MKVVVFEFKKISPFISLFSAQNKFAKILLEAMGKQYFDNTDLYILFKLGCKIEYKKTHTKNRKKL